MIDPPAPRGDLQLPALSARIAALNAWMLRDGRSIRGNFSRPLSALRLDWLPEPPELPLKYDPSFDASPPGEASPQMKRPDAIEDALEESTPQFTLRHTHRVTRYADAEWLEYRALQIRDEAQLEALEEARRCHYDRPELLDLDAFAEEVALRRGVVIESAWDQHFGRPDEEEQSPDPRPKGE